MAGSGSVLEEEGIVMEIRGDRVRVLTQRTGFCEPCPQEGSCQIGEGHTIVVEAKDPLGVRVGQRVRVVVQTRTFLRASFLAYGMPLLFLLGGVAVGYQLAQVLDLSRHADSLAAIGGLAALPFSLLVIRWYERRLQSGVGFWPMIVEIMQE